MEGDINGEHIVIGSIRLFENSENKYNRNDNDMKSVLDGQKQIHYDGRKMLGFISVNDKPAAAIVFGDQIRPRVRLMMQSLLNLGVKQTVMLTGDIQIMLKRLLSKQVLRILNRTFCPNIK